MRTIHISQSGGPEVLTLAEAPIPNPGPGEVLIQVAAAGINQADLHQRAGHYPPPPGASPILGLEVSGRIAELGPDAGPRWKTGDEVCALVTGGGYAEFCLASAGSCLPVPNGMSLISSAALPEAVFTVWANLFAQPWLRAGETLLVQGGSSGVGTTAIQMARNFGVRVITTAGSVEKCDFCLSLGAERAFNYREEDWFAGALAWSEDRGIDVILDMIAGDYFPKHLRLLANGGRLIHIAASRGSEVATDLRLVISRRLVVTGSMLRPRSVSEKAELRDEIEQQVWPLLEAGKLRPVIDRIFPLAGAAAAHQRMSSGEHTGKLLLQVS